MAGSPLDPQRDALLGALLDAGVNFVLIGGAAIQSHGEAYVTQDVDVTPERTEANLRRFADILNQLSCRLVVQPDDTSQDVPLPPKFFTPVNLGQQSVWNLNTVHGKLDVTFTPSGFPDGFEQLVAGAELRAVAQTSVEVRIAALVDVEHSKRTAGRPKDRAYLAQVGRP